MARKPFTQVKSWVYVEQATGKILENFFTKQYFEWQIQLANGPGYIMVREIVISNSEFSS